MRLRGLPALHRVAMVSVRQPVAGHVRHAGEGDGHHRLRGVRALRRPGALPQAPHPVSTHRVFVYVLFVCVCVFSFRPYLDLCGDGARSVHVVFQQSSAVFSHSLTRLHLGAAHCNQTICFGGSFFFFFLFSELCAQTAGIQTTQIFNVFVGVCVL